MREEIKEWLDKADNDLKVAKDNLKLANYETVCFYSQQAAEKVLKALLIKRKGGFQKIHDLVMLATQNEAPKEIMGFCEELTKLYIITRYPGPDEPIEKNRAKDMIQKAEKVVEWVKKNL